MFELIAWAELATAVQAVGSLCQVVTAVIAVSIAVVTFRYTKRQNALSLINQNNSLANLVNTTLIQSPKAREALGRLSDPIVGDTDDAVLFMYLNYVHNTFRTFQIGAITATVWEDTLASCIVHLVRLERGQVERLLARGYERSFSAQVLAGFDKATHVPAAARPAPARRPRLRVAAAA